MHFVPEILPFIPAQPFCAIFTNLWLFASFCKMA